MVEQSVVPIKRQPRIIKKRHWYCIIFVFFAVQLTCLLLYDSTVSSYLSKQQILQHQKLDDVMAKQNKSMQQKNENFIQAEVNRRVNKLFEAKQLEALMESARYKVYSQQEEQLLELKKEVAFLLEKLETLMKSAGKQEKNLVDAINGVPTQLINLLEKKLALEERFRGLRAENELLEELAKRRSGLLPEVTPVKPAAKATTKKTSKPEKKSRFTWN